LGGHCVGWATASLESGRAEGKVKWVVSLGVRIGRFGN
jgi:hypothetical protein